MVEQDLHGARILIVESRFYEDISDALLAGAERVLTAAGAVFDRITVPGALEIAAAMAMAIDAGQQQGRPYDGAVALGCVIRGETYHFEIVANESARALTDLSVSNRLPLGNGILTVENEQQAVMRADPKQGDKGADAALAAIQMATLFKKLEQ